MNIIMKENGNLYDVSLEAFYKSMEEFEKQNEEVFEHEKYKTEKITLDLPQKLIALKEFSRTKLSLTYLAIIHEQKMYRKLHMTPETEKVIVEKFYQTVYRHGFTEAMQAVLEEGNQTDNLFTYRNRKGVYIVLSLMVNANGTYRMSTKGARIHSYTPNINHNELLAQKQVTKTVVLPNVYSSSLLCWGEVRQRQALETTTLRGLDKFTNLFFTNYFNTHLMEISITKVAMEHIANLMQEEAKRKPIFQPLFDTPTLYEELWQGKNVYLLIGLCNLLQLDIGRIEEILQKY